MCTYTHVYIHIHVYIGELSSPWLRASSCAASAARKASWAAQESDLRTIRNTSNMTASNDV